MGRVLVVNHVSLDGVYQAPGRADEDPRDGFARGGWARAADDPLTNQTVGEAMGGGPAFLFGRHTYEILHESWSGEDSFSAAFSQARKYVVSRTLAEPLDWVNSSLLAGQDDVAALRERDDATLTIFGSGELIASLAAAGLIDEYLLMIHPLVLGHGRRLFADAAARTLRLVWSAATPTGVLLARYTPA